MIAHIIGSLCCLALIGTHSAAEASDNQGASFQSNQRESISPLQLITSGRAVEEAAARLQDFGYQPQATADGYNQAHASSRPNWQQQTQQQQQRQSAHQADRIKQALGRFLEANPNALANFRAEQMIQHPQDALARIQIRSAPSPFVVNDQEISQWFETASDGGDGQSNGLQARDELRKQLGSSSSSSYGASSGHKTIRNIQPVVMRLPPRFGKRNCC